MVTDPEKGRNGLGFAKVDQEPRVYGSCFAVKGSVRKGRSQGGERVVGYSQDWDPGRWEARLRAGDPSQGTNPAVSLDRQRRHTSSLCQVAVTSTLLNSSTHPFEQCSLMQNMW